MNAYSTAVSGARRRAGAARRALATLAVSGFAVVWAQALTTLVRPAPAPAFAGLISVVTVVAIILAAIFGGGPRRWGSVALVTAFVATAGTVWAHPMSGASLWILPLVAAVFASAAAVMAARLPRALDRWPRFRPARAAVWAGVAVLAVVQIARLATWAADPSHGFELLTDHPFWAGHECLPAYVYAAELTERGAINPWDSAHYPGLNPEAQAHTRIQGMTPEDPYLYSPQFLLLPRLAIALTDSYPVLRTVGLALNFSLIFGGMLWLTVSLGGRSGLRAALWLPLMAVAFPTLYNLQFGQAHLAAVVLAVMAMVLFERRRHWLGGGLLASAILIKIFPAILLVSLAAHRRLRELGTTLVWGLGATAGATLVFGPSILGVFLTRHLPRLQAGEASNFGEVWPEIHDLVVAANQGVSGLLAKLTAMGLGNGLAEAGPVSSRVFICLLTLGVVYGSWRLRSVPVRRPHLQTYLVGWLGIVGLASLASPSAFADYVPSAAICMVVMMGVRHLPRHRMGRLAFGVALCFQMTLLGSTPIGQFADSSIMIPLSLAGQLSLFGLLLWGAAPLLGMRRAATYLRSAPASDSAAASPLALTAPDLAAGESHRALISF